jgi:hypothetical protein
MSAMPIARFFCCAAASLLISQVSTAHNQSLLQDQNPNQVHEFGSEVYPALVQRSLLSLPPSQSFTAGTPVVEVPNRIRAKPNASNTAQFKPPVAAEDRLRLRQNQALPNNNDTLFSQPSFNADGILFNGALPPDTNGSVGRRYFIQTVNSFSGTDVLVLDKSSHDVVTRFTLRDLAQGTATGCSQGIGDGIVLFDESVDNGPDLPQGRWFLSEFTFDSVCIYISQNHDPIDGGWYVYEFASASGGLPDYPKYAVWHDAYYLGANEDRVEIPGDGTTLYALDRERMLRGETARPIQFFEIPDLPGFGFQVTQPADWDGALQPPADSPAIFLRHNDDEFHHPGNNDSTQDFIELWRFQVDWNTPANSQISGPERIVVSEFESQLCPQNVLDCVPQTSSNVALFSIHQHMLWRNQYRNFGSHESITGSYVVDVLGGDNNLHGIRWFELRRQGNTSWQLHQEGTFSPDTTHRFLPSLAMDESGNIALAYSVSDIAGTFPGLRYAGRLASDPVGIISQGEHELVAGSAANASFRFGDYAALNVDPSDGCTFWFTSQYNPSANWNTRIAAFRFESCGSDTIFSDSFEA